METGENKTMKKKFASAAFTALSVCIVVVFLIFYLGTRHKKNEVPQTGFGMFSWGTEAMAEEEAETLSDCIRLAHVAAIYQEFSEDSFESGEADRFIERMGKQKVQVYALMGEREWAYEADGSSLIEAMENAADYNRKRTKYRIDGVMVDVEPYLTDQWDEGYDKRAELMDSYLSCMEHAYEYAREQELEFFVCIPTFYDITNGDILEKLISGACDGIAVMNYNRTDEYGQIAREVGYAREYGKKIICIYELQEAGSHDLEEINTYANEGMEALYQSAERLKNQFGYEKLQFAYHYYKPLKALLPWPEESEDK